MFVCGGYTQTYRILDLAKNRKVLTGVHEIWSKKWWLPTAKVNLKYSLLQSFRFVMGAMVFNQWKNSYSWLLNNQKIADFSTDDALIFHKSFYDLYNRLNYLNFLDLLDPKFTWQIVNKRNGFQPPYLRTNTIS